MARLIVLVSLCWCTSWSLAMVSVIDFTGRTVQLEQPAQRIIALAPHIVENVYAAGAGDLLVGAVSYSNFPEAAKALLQVGSYNAFSVEAILALQPDLVIAWVSGNGGAVIEQMNSLGIPVYVDQIDTLEHIGKALVDIATLAGRQSEGEQAANAYNNRLNKLKQRYSQQHAVGVFYQVWNEPLQTINGEHLISDVIRLCGGDNIFADAKAIAPKVSIESIFANNPDTIIASGMGQARPEWLDEWLRWPLLQAVQKQHLYFIPPDIIQRHTVRILDGAAMMCDHLDKVRPIPRPATP